MRKDDTKKLRSCIDLLDHYGTRLRKSLEDSEQAREPPAVAILRAFAFGHATLKAIIVVAGQGEECGVCLPTICRPFYELAVRVLWASRQPDGWERLQRHYAEEDKNWASRAVEMKIRSWTDYAQPRLDNAKSVLGRTDINGNPYERPPSMTKTFEQVEQHDVDYGFKTWQSSALFEYAYLWMMMCGTAHAHVVQIVRSPAAHTRIAVAGALVATFALLRATAVFTSRDKAGLIEAVGLMVKKMIRILKGEVDLGLDDVVFTRDPA